jgi:hypothetical protein
VLNARMKASSAAWRAVGILISTKNVSPNLNLRCWSVPGRGRHEQPHDAFGGGFELIKEAGFLL